MTTKLRNPKLKDLGRKVKRIATEAGRWAVFVGGVSAINLAINLGLHGVDPLRQIYSKPQPFGMTVTAPMWEDFETSGKMHIREYSIKVRNSEGETDYVGIVSNARSNSGAVGYDPRNGELSFDGDILYEKEAE